ncbi:EH signature domain-containing protein [Laribacter hongkongensis]|uniref:EH signature domain-containing protein n=1 Tax=Laribacter hongkongensis TaxID=168471 RepID=UPI001EFC5D56|nr:EH signature domain-containing protein [Laribacter hongkongensis]MCG9059770.1 EH signature domain-containing protein [Laribacter hongkongensis]MCG9086510.1 EH signature domain-containing protein [Laribacter hongkongensis]
MSLPIEELPDRLERSLDRWGCRKQMVTIQAFDWSHLRARVEQVRQQFGLATAPPIPPRQLRINALHKLRTQQPEAVTVRDWRLIGWGLADECGNAGCALADGLLFPTIAEHFAQEINGGRLGRKTWLGLVSSYLAHMPEGGLERKHWLQLRKLALDGFHKIRQGKQRGCAWVELVGRHLDLFTDDAGVKLGEAMFEGHQQVVEELKSFLQIPAESWLWTAILSAQLKRVVALDDDGFVSRIDGMLDWAERHPHSTDQILASLLTRYEQSAQLKEKPHQRLKSASLEAWGCPQIGRHKGRWSVCVEDRVSNMVMRWFAKEDLETFFSLLRDEKETDERRLNYWLRYVDQMVYTRIVMGRNALLNQDSNFRQFREDNGNRISDLNGGQAADNAFIMQIGDFVFVEFSKVGNACYFYRNKEIPFEIDAKNLNLNSDLKVPSDVDVRDLHNNRFTHAREWEPNADSIMSKLGIAIPGAVPFMMKSSEYAESKSIRSHARAESAIEKTAARGSTFERFDIVGEVRKLASSAGYDDLRFEDFRPKGGALWVRSPELRKIDARLKDLGFKYKKNGGYWIP